MTLKEYATKAFLADLERESLTYYEEMRRYQNQLNELTENFAKQGNTEVHKDNRYKEWKEKADKLSGVVEGIDSTKRKIKEFLTMMEAE